MRVRPEPGSLGPLTLYPLDLVEGGPPPLDLPQASPPGLADGHSCAGFTHVAVAIGSLVNVLNYDIEVWVSDGLQWVQAVDDTGAPIDINGLTSSYGQIFTVAGFVMFSVQINAVANNGAPATIKKTYTNFGPGA